MAKYSELADKIDLHLSLTTATPGFHLTDDDLRCIVAALRASRPSPTSQDEMENYRLALAWIKDQSTDQHSREIAATALLTGDQRSLTIDEVPSCGQENDYRRARPGEK